MTCNIKKKGPSKSLLVLAQREKFELGFWVQKPIGKKIHFLKKVLKTVSYCIMINLFINEYKPLNFNDIH